MEVNESQLEWRSRANPDYLTLFFSEDKACSLRNASLVYSVYCLHGQRKQKLEENNANHCEQPTFIFLETFYMAWNHVDCEKSNLRLFPLR